MVSKKSAQILTDKELIERDLKDKTKTMGMVRWFSLPVLLIAARDSILSSIFGSYADRRLVHAALNVINEEALQKEYDYIQKIKANKNDEVWLDYVADLGDGFNSTYSIAYLLGQKEIEVDGHKLPRGSVLIMGGDQVYPLATKEEYKRRLEVPYNYAFPKSDSPDAVKPYLFLIPGNHDWYDGLTLFLAKFCKGIGAHLGGGSSWRMFQTRSYFAFQLPNDWWVWGLDTQLGEDIDQPQEDYFARIVKKMSKGSKIILCASVPTWLDADSEDEQAREKFKRGIDHIASNIIHKNSENVRICTVISGDKHHYSRYWGEKTGTQFITSGGGGAFLHTTHHLKDSIVLYWFRTAAERLNLAKKTTDSGVENQEDVCFPTRAESRSLAKKNFLFPLVNWDFCISLGVAYALIGMVIVTARSGAANDLYDENSLTWITNSFVSVIVSPIFWGLWVLYYAIFKGYADKAAGKNLRRLLGGIHSLAHLTAVSLIVSILPAANTELAKLINLESVDWHPKSWEFLFLMLQTGAAGGVLGGFIWGTYLLLVSTIWALHFNDASSALRINGYKNFLRMCIRQDSLTIYPIGLKKVPNKKGWVVNPNMAKNNQNEPYVIPVSPLGISLIEAPITIDLKK